MSQYTLTEAYEHPDGAPSHEVDYPWSSSSPLNAIPRDEVQSFFFGLFRVLADKINEITNNHERTHGGFDAGGCSAIVELAQANPQQPSYVFVATSDNGGGNNWAQEKLAYLNALAKTGRNYTAPMPVRSIFSVIQDPQRRAAAAARLRGSLLQSSDIDQASSETVDQPIVASDFPVENTLLLGDYLATVLAVQYHVVPYYGALRFRLRIDFSFDGGLTCKPAFSGWVTVAFSGANQFIDLEIASQIIYHLLDYIRISSGLVWNIGFDFETDDLFEDSTIKRWLLWVLKKLGYSTSLYN